MIWVKNPVDTHLPRILLDRAGQQAFWDRQAAHYDTAAMTCDNAEELESVQALCHQFCRVGYQCDDVVTLGGAVASRDPAVVMDVLAQHDQQPTHVYFNDLSDAMVSRAQHFALAPYADRTIIVVLPGPVHLACKRIVHKPRRVIIGVYRANALIATVPESGYRADGMDTYVRESDILGTHFIAEPVYLDTKRYCSLNACFYFTKFDSGQQRARTRTLLREYVKAETVDAIRIVGVRNDRDGYFLSHWYTDWGIRRLLSQCFSINRLKSLRCLQCPKGFVICIDPVEKPVGMVTMLNNVLGNVIPNEQAKVLQAIDRISA